MRRGAWRSNVLNELSLFFSLLILFYLFHPLLLPLFDNRLEFVYGDFYSIIGINSGLEFLRQVYYIFNERVGYVDLLARFLLLGGALSLISTVVEITHSQILSAAITISLVLGAYGVYKLVALFETSPVCRAILTPALEAFYFLNLWSIERIGHVWLWLTYAVLPLYLYLGLSYAYRGGADRLIPYSLLLSVYGIVPHNLIYMAALHLFLVIYLLFLDYKRAVVFAAVPIAIYALTNAPIFIALFSTRDTSYPVHITLDELSILSRNGELINFFTLTNNWWPQVPSNLLNSPIFKASSISLFLVATATMIARTEKKTRLLIHLAYAYILLVAFVAQGTNNPLIATTLEHMGKLGVLDLAGPFREWARISILAPPLLIIIIAAGIASTERGKDLLLTLFSLLTAVNIASSPLFAYIYQVWAPAHVPSEYYMLNKEIPLQHKTLWIYPGKATDILGTWRYIWNPDKAISGGVASGNLERSIGSTYNINLQFVKMLTQVEAPPQLLTALNIKYVILRTDILGATSFSANYTYLQCQKLAYLTVCQNPHNSTPAYVTQAVVTADLDGDTLYAIFAEAPPNTAVVSQLINETTIVVHNYKSAWLYQELKRRGYIVAPSHVLYMHNPYKYWSLAYTSDPLHVEWHPYLATMGIENWQSDYGEGLAFTWAQGVKLDVPFATTSPGEYVLLARVFENSRGGLLRMYIDGAPVAEVNTTSQLNKFVWRKAGVYKLEAGRHVLTVENVEGFNAVNVVAFVPAEEYRELEQEYERAVGNLTLVHLFTANDLLKRMPARNEGGALVLGAGGEAWQHFDVVKPGNYIIAVKLEGKASVEVDGAIYNASSHGPSFAYVGPLYLTGGRHTVAIKSISNETLRLYSVWIYPAVATNRSTVEELLAMVQPPAKILEMRRINPTHWVVKVASEKPHLLTLAESYDPHWEARIYENGRLVQTIRPILTNGVVMGFPINKTGDLTVEIRYVPQRLYQLGIAISVSTFTIIALYLVWQQNKKLLNRFKIWVYVTVGGFLVAPGSLIHCLSHRYIPSSIPLTAIIRRLAR